MCRICLSFCQPIGSTDSETAFCYMAEYLKNRFRRKPSEMEILKPFKTLPKSSHKGTFNFILFKRRMDDCPLSPTNLHYLTRKAPLW